MIRRDQLVMELVTYSSYENPLGARYFCDKYKQKGETLDQYRRQLANMVREINDEIDRNKKLSSPKRIIMSCNGGYYIPQNREEALRGRQYYAEKVTDMQRKLNRMDHLINDIYPEPEQSSLF